MAADSGVTGARLEFHGAAQLGAKHGDLNRRARNHQLSKENPPEVGDFDYVAEGFDRVRLIDACQQ